LNRKIAQSMEEAVQSYTVDHIKMLVKAGIQRYIESFMNKDGGNRSLYETFTKLGLSYITDKSFDPTSDPTLRKLQLARLFEQIHQQLPAILIVDSEFKIVPMNFTGLQRARTQNGYWYGTVQVIRELSISVVAGTVAQSNTDFLQGLLSTMFGELKWLAGGTRMTGNRDLGETWVMTMGVPQFTSITQTPVGESPTDRVWSTTVEIPNVLFEDCIIIQQKLDRNGGIQGGIMNPPGGDITNVVPIINAPTTIPMNQSTLVSITKFQPKTQRIVISDPNIATYEPKSRTLTPRRLGTFQLQVLKQRTTVGTGGFDNQDGASYDVVAYQTIKVTPR
jgi:hypothetical protein